MLLFSAPFLSVTRRALRLMWLLPILLVASAAAKTPLERQLNAAGNELPPVLYYREIHKIALNLQMIGIKEMLLKHNIVFHDANDDSRAYIRTQDLLAMCGRDCTADSEWGSFLTYFAVQKHGR